MSLSLQNKKILITGSTDGLGKELAFGLAQQGAEIIVHGRDEKKVANVVSELPIADQSEKHSGIVCDLNDVQHIGEKFSAIKKLDILINNAGVWLEGGTIDASPQKILELIHVNLATPLLATQLLLPVLQKSEFAQILNVVSVAGIEIPVGYSHTIYSATKFGMQGFSEALTKEFDNQNLRVMGYYPGGMETNIFKKAGDEYKTHEPWMFDPKESVEAIIFMLTRNPKVNVKRMDLINHQQK